MKNHSYSAAMVADILSISKSTLSKWDKKGKLVALPNLVTGKKEYFSEQLLMFEQFKKMASSDWQTEVNIKPIRTYKAIELFAGAGGLAIGLEKAGFNTVMLNEIDKYACSTLRVNRPNWHIVEGDIAKIDFVEFEGKIDLLSGGFPCQAFSYAGQRLGFEDTRGTLFFEFGRALNQIKPKIFMAENVRGLLSHDNGRTLETIKQVLGQLGYILIEPRIIQAIFYKVPQKRERLIIIGVRRDLYDEANFKWPSPYNRIMTLKDALKKGELYDSDVPESSGAIYPKRKQEILFCVPQGGYWRDLPENLQKEYMQGSYFLGGGKTGMARRLSWDEPSLTLTCSPAQKQTERCHPEETRPLKLREYARIQTFPDDWEFMGSLINQYKQIGNAVPVNLAYRLGNSLVDLLNNLEGR